MREGVRNGEISVKKRCYGWYFLDNCSCAPYNRTTKSVVLNREKGVANEKEIV